MPCFVFSCLNFKIENVEDVNVVFSCNFEHLILCRRYKFDRSKKIVEQFLNNLKRGSKYRAEAGLFKRGAGTFPIYFFYGLSFLHLEITLPFAKLCYAFEEKLFFSATIIL